MRTTTKTVVKTTNTLCAWAMMSLTAVLLFCGCGQSNRPEGLPELQPVTLNLSQAGNPLAEATVSLYPVDTTNQWSSGGFSDEQGDTVLVTHGGFDGVPVGKYKVVVVKSLLEGTAGTADEAGNSAMVTLVERQYTSRKTTPLEIDIQEGENVIQLDVGKPVKRRTT